MSFLHLDLFGKRLPNTHLINCVGLFGWCQVYYGLLKEPEIEVPLDDEDEEAENEEGKPKKKKAKKDSLGSKSKKQDPNAPQQNRYRWP